MDSEVALNKACAKFASRVEFMEKACIKSGKEFVTLSSTEQEKLWQEAKANENSKY